MTPSPLGYQTIFLLLPRIKFPPVVWLARPTTKAKKKKILLYISTTQPLLHHSCHHKYCLPSPPTPLLLTHHHSTSTTEHRPTSPITYSPPLPIILPTYFCTLRSLSAYFLFTPERSHIPFSDPRANNVPYPTARRRRLVLPAFVPLPIQPPAACKNTAAWPMGSV